MPFPAIAWLVASRGHTRQTDEEALQKIKKTHIASQLFRYRLPDINGTAAKR